MQGSLQRNDSALGWTRLSTEPLAFSRMVESASMIGALHHTCAVLGVWAQQDASCGVLQQFQLHRERVLWRLPPGVRVWLRWTKGGREAVVCSYLSHLFPMEGMQPESTCSTPNERSSASEAHDASRQAGKVICLPLHCCPPVQPWKYNLQVYNRSGCWYCCLPAAVDWRWGTCPHIYA